MSPEVRKFLTLPQGVTLGSVAVIIGSIFMISDYFMDPFNTPKLFWVELTILLLVCLYCITQSKVRKIDLGSTITRWGMVLIVSTIFLRITSYVLIFCLIFYLGLLLNLSKNQRLKAGELIFWMGALQAVYYLLGYFQLLPDRFAGNGGGSFDHVTGFVYTEVLMLPLGFLLSGNTSGWKKKACYFGLILITSSVLLSQSRAGIMALGVVILLNISRRYLKGIVIGAVLCCVIGIGMFSGSKTASGEGRLLIYRVVLSMVKEKPFSGFGKGNFQLHYMNYQGKYLQNETGENRQLAGNIKHPFNEFLLILTEFGVLGAGVWFLLLLRYIILLRTSAAESKWTVLSALAALGICACFSYPLHYVSVWLLIIFYLSWDNNSDTTIQYPLKIRGIFLVLAAGLLIWDVNLLFSEMKWKKIADSCLKGRTPEMLPAYEKLYPSLKTNSLFLFNYAVELNMAGKYENSLILLQQCRKKFDDYDLSLLMAANYFELGGYQQAEYFLQQCADMIPCRFWPYYQLFLIYKETENKKMALKIAKIIAGKKIKVASYIISKMKREARHYINTETVIPKDTLSSGAEKNH